MRKTATLLTLLAVSVTALAQDAIQVSAEPRVRIVTNVGEFVIELDRRRAPLTVDNFLEYVAEGYYSGTIFHRVVAGFLAQGGGYTADLQLKKGGHAVVNEAGNGLSNLRGTVAMARTVEPHSADSQFYVNLADNIDLNPRPSRWGYAVFGEVVEGMEVVDKIGHVATGAGGDFERNVPVEPIIIESATLLTE